MIIDIIRDTFTDKSTVGKLYVNQEYICETLEDVVREEKIYGKTAIPKGTYTVIITPSNRFKQNLPLILNVPNYEGVRIHTGNTSEDTHGCILVGMTRDKDFIGKSKQAFLILFPLIEKAVQKNELINIKIS